MAVSSISSSPVANNQPSAQQQFRQQFMQLLRAIKSGNLDAAQKAYGQLAQLKDSVPEASNGPVAQTLDQIGQALKSGDIGGAQQALQSLQQQMAQGVHRGHHHHRHRQADAPPADGNADAASAAAAAPSASPQVGTLVNTVV